MQESRRTGAKQCLARLPSSQVARQAGTWASGRAGRPTGRQAGRQSNGQDLSYLHLQASSSACLARLSSDWPLPPAPAPAAAAASATFS